MPGILPSLANSRKQIRQRSKSPIYALPLPHLKQRRTTRVLNFGFLSDLAMTDFFAINIMYLPTKRPQTGTALDYQITLSASTLPNSSQKTRGPYGHAGLVFEPN